MIDFTSQRCTGFARTAFFCVAVLCANGIVAAEEPPSKSPTKTIRDWLEAHSWVVTAEKDDIEKYVKTNIEKYTGGKLVLNYEHRILKDGEMIREQFITYRFDPKDMARNSINIIKLPSKESAPDMWMIEARLKEDTPLIDYSNYFADYAEDGTSDSSNSKGKSKNIIFGYTLNLDDAKILGELVKDLITAT
jgi:hypothetical protein